MTEPSGCPYPRNVMKLFIWLFFPAFFTATAPEQKLTEYESFSHYDIGKYSMQYTRSFDPEGIILQKNEYHPLTISIYGIMNYDAFIKTKDSVYYYEVLKQYRYFSNSEHLVYSDNGQSVGLPYMYDFKDMKAPWFSGMTQGTAVSFLLRYYALTKNETALDLCKKLMHLLLKKEEDGGTIGRTLEGGLWIEEYPKSTKAKSVLNGFVNGWIGVYEYCLMFPNDHNAAAIRDSCYNEMINNMYRFDMPTWTSYSRNGTPVSNMYLRYQLQEFDHLYSLLGDVQLRYQMRIWSRMGMNQLDKETKFLRLPEYQYAMQLKGNAIKDSCVFNNLTGFSAGLVTQAPAYTKRQVIKYQFSSDRYYCELQITDGDSAKNNEIKFAADLNGSNVPLQCMYSGNSIVVESVSPFNGLSIKFPSKKYRDKCSVVLRSYDYKTGALPMFAFHDVSKIETIEKGKVCNFSFTGTNLTNATVFYRYAKKGVTLTSQEFTHQQTFLLNGGSFVAPETGTYEFFISYDVMHPHSSVSKLKLELL